MRGITPINSELNGMTVTSSTEGTAEKRGARARTSASAQGRAAGGSQEAAGAPGGKRKRAVTLRRGVRPAASRASRAPAIWRGEVAGYVPSAENVPAQIDEGHGFQAWRLVSAFIVVIVLAMLAIFFTSDAFYIHSASVAGLETMTLEEVYALSGVSDLHLFWVDVGAVRAKLLQSPTIATASVSVGWEQPLVRIEIEERTPALIWEQSGVPVWVDLQGRIMRQRQDRSDLLRVLADNAGDGAPQSIDPTIINGAVQLHQLVPDQPTFRYNPEYGLGYNDARGWEVWLGTGLNMPEKVLIYNAIAADLSARGVLPRTIFVTNPDSPHWCCQAGA